MLPQHNNPGIMFTPLNKEPLVVSLFKMVFVVKFLRFNEATTDFIGKLDFTRDFAYVKFVIWCFP